MTVFKVKSVRWLICLLGLVLAATTPPLALAQWNESVTSAATSSAPVRTGVTNASLRFVCAGDSVGSIIYVNGQRKGACPLKMAVSEGDYTIHAAKRVDDKQEAVFDEIVFVGGRTAQRVDVQLGAPQLTRAWRKILEEKRRQQLEIYQATVQKLVEQGVQAMSDYSFKECADCPEMMIIPSGSVAMGGTNSNELPVHEVQIQMFAIGKTAITQRQWQSVMGSNPGAFTLCGPDCPVESVSWNDAQAFIHKLIAMTGRSYRLPSEAEWEYACRAGGKYSYCGSDNVDAVGWYGANSAGSTHPVGRKQPNVFGLDDMSGDVWQWVEDGYHSNYSGAPADGSAWLGGGEQRYRVARGGSWFSAPTALRAASRNGFESDSVYNNVGFRVARTLVTP